MVIEMVDSIDQRIASRRNGASIKKSALSFFERLVDNKYPVKVELYRWSEGGSSHSLVKRFQRLEVIITFPDYNTYKQVITPEKSLLITQRGFEDYPMFYVFQIHPNPAPFEYRVIRESEHRDLYDEKEKGRSYLTE